MGWEGCVAREVAWWVWPQQLSQLPARFLLLLLLTMGLQALPLPLLLLLLLLPILLLRYSVCVHTVACLCSTPRPGDHACPLRHHTQLATAEAQHHGVGLEAR